MNINILLSSIYSKIMKKEIELKILNIEPKKIKEKIEKVGGEQILGPTLFHELYFESSAQKQRYSSFRLRLEGGVSILNLKMENEVSEQFEIRDEYEVEVSDFETTKKILELAGFTVFREREKMREAYRIGSVRIEIDTYPNIKPYIELESETEEDIKKLVELLGFNMKDTTKNTATVILKEAGLDPNKLKFSD